MQVERIRDLLHRHSMRMTPQRTLLLSLLENAGGHVDADQLYEVARQQDARIGRATVYRNLRRLAEIGILRQHLSEYPTAKVYYEIATSAEHYHFTCQRCGKVIEFSCPEVEQVTRRLYNTHGIVTTHSHVTLFGYCAECLEAIKREVQDQVEGRVVSLSELSPGQTGVIVHVGGEGRLRRRFMEMGLVKGERVLVERLAPLGDPLEFLIKGYHLSLRRNEAVLIQVELDGS